MKINVIVANKKKQRVSVGGKQKENKATNREWYIPAESGNNFR